MNLKMTIHNVKSIRDFSIELPLEQGLYALTGENGCGKSTLLACAATSFYNPLMYSYFGAPYDGSSIEFSFCGKKRRIGSVGGRWFGANNFLGITGFYEGSLIYGNRFKDVDFSKLKTLANMKETHLLTASSFVREKLGEILHDDKNFYKELFILDEQTTKENNLLKQPYYYRINGRLINQLSMSTGENLLISILHSIEMRKLKENYKQNPSLILLDEIELALHSSALRRLVYVLEELSVEHNFAVYFSTHSIELIRSINPSNIYYLQRHKNDSLEIVNPCYPVYATRNLESSNSGHDYIIMVEDNLAKSIVDRILYEKQLLGNKRVLVIAVGGWTQVLRFAYDTIRSNLTLSSTKILIVLDRDIKNDVAGFMKNSHIGFTNPPNYLPIKSLEKYLLEHLVEHVEIQLFRKLNDYLFQNRSLTDIVRTYTSKANNNEYEYEKVKNGKAFFKELQQELRNLRKTEDDLSQIVVDYLFEKNSQEMKELTQFLCNTLS